MPLRDEEILSIYRRGNHEKALSLILDQYQERIYWLIRKLVLNHDDSNDVCQNVFIKVWKNLPNFRGESGLYTWMYRIATNESLTFLSSKKRKNNIPIETENYNLAEQLRSDPYFDGDEFSEKLQLAINTLPEKQKIVFNLRYFEEMKYDEMAEVLETSVGALKASYHHAAKKIENFLREA